MMPIIKGKPISGIETTVRKTGTQYKIVTVDSGIVNQAILHYNRNTQAVTFVSKQETSIANEVMKIVKKNKKASTTKIDIETLQGTTVKEITDVIVK